MQKKLLTYQKNHKLELLAQELQVEKANLNRVRNKLLSLQNELEDKRTEIAKIQNLLQQKPERWELKKAITNDALWQKILNEEEIKAIKTMKLSSEIINPIYRRLKNRLSQAKLTVKSLPDQINYYQQLISRKEQIIKQKQSRLKKWQQEVDRIKQDLAHYENIYQNQVWLAENELDRLRKHVNDVESTYNKLAAKMEEVRITKAQKTSDVDFVAEAVPPTQPIGPNKKLIMAIALVLGGMLGVFAAFLVEFMKGEVK